MRKTEVRYTDDLDGSAADETLRFGLDGAWYEVDVNAVHASELRAALAPFVRRARRVGRTTAVDWGRRTVAANRAENRLIRDWAAHRGIVVSGYGRIPASVIAQFRAERAAGTRPGRA